MSFTSAVQPVPSHTPDGLFSQSVEGPSAPGGAGVSCERAHATSAGAGAGALHRRLRCHRRAQASRLGLGGGRLRRRLHRRGPATRPRTGRHPRRRRPDPHDLQRTPRDPRTAASRPGPQTPGRRGGSPAGRGIADARHLGRRHRLDRRCVPGAGRGQLGLHQRARHHRPLARRAVPVLPARGHRQRRPGARCRRREPHLQALPGIAGQAAHRRRLHHRHLRRRARHRAHVQLSAGLGRPRRLRGLPRGLGNEPRGPLGRSHHV